MSIAALIKKNDKQIGINWVNSQDVSMLLIKYKINSKEYLDKYGYKIIQYIGGVFKGSYNIGECKIRAKFLHFLENHNIEISDLYVIYLSLKKELITQISKSNLYNIKSLNLINEFFDSNIEGVIREYSKIHFLKITKSNALAKSHKKLQIFDKMKDRFLGITSHEMRTPLTVIKGYSSLMLEGSFGKLTAKQKGFVDKIFNNAGSLIVLVDNMLDVTRLKLGKINLNIGPVNTGTIINSVIKELSLIYKDKNLNISFENKNKINLNIKTDGEKLKQVFINLVNNACKFTAANGKIKIAVIKKEANKDLITFSVSDSGIGIDKNKIKTIFNEFYQIDNYLKREYEGTGLGLMITKNIIRNLKGKIGVESVKGKGSNFIFTIQTNL